MTARYPIRVLLTAALLPALAGAANADTALQREIAGIERRSQLLSAHRGRLEGQLAEQSKRIVRLKRQRSSVGRDYQLRGALRSTQRLASKLTKIRSSLRSIRSRLLAAYDRAISSAKTPQLRRRWQQKRVDLLRKDRQRSGRLVTSGKASPLDGAEDLEEKADLLKDSEEKVRRQLKRMRRRITVLQRRTKLRKHGRAASNSPFVEGSAKRLGGKRTTKSPTLAAKSSADDRDGVAESPKHNPSPPPSPGPAANDFNSQGGAGDPSTGAPSGGYSPGESGGGLSGTPSATLRRALDPQTFRELQRALKSGNLKARLAALKKARAKLKKLAKSLSSKSKALRSRASKMKKKRRK